jgi:hypothetical protein
MTTNQLQQMWDARIPEFPLSLDHAELWIAYHSQATLERGLQVTFAKWERDKSKMDKAYLIRYANKTLNNIKARTEVEQ